LTRIDLSSTPLTLIGDVVGVGDMLLTCDLRH
jgi:hypothetical protein